MSLVCPTSSIRVAQDALDGWQKVASDPGQRTERVLRSKSLAPMDFSSWAIRELSADCDV
jgi:hypothetical protein